MTRTPIQPFDIRNPVEVAAGLVFRNGLLLITQRRPQDHLGGLWEFPGGKRHPSESFEECLARELREELGIEIVVGELLDAITHKYPEKTVHLKFFRCDWCQNEPQRLGCHDFAWINLQLHENGQEFVSITNPSSSTQRRQGSKRGQASAFRHHLKCKSKSLRTARKHSDHAAEHQGQPHRR